MMRMSVSLSVCNVSAYLAFSRGRHCIIYDAKFLGVGGLSNRSIGAIHLLILSVALVIQRHRCETQADYKDRRKEQISAQRRRHRQTRAAVKIHHQKEPTTGEMERDETILRISGVYCHLCVCIYTSNLHKLYG